MTSANSSRRNFKNPVLAYITPWYSLLRLLMLIRVLMNLYDSFFTSIRFFAFFSEIVTLRIRYVSSKCNILRNYGSIIW